jgi:hypothetical protein
MAATSLETVAPEVARIPLMRRHLGGSWFPGV